MSETADIGKQQVAAVYAKALIGASETTGSTGEVVEELDSLVDDVLVKFPEFEATLGSTRLSAEEKVGLIGRVFEKGSDQLKTFLKVLAHHNRLDCLREIRRESRRLFNKLRNRVEVQVTTAEALTDQQRDEIVDALQRKMSCEVDLIHRIDENIIGGMVVRVGDTIIDGSVRNKLAQMKSQAVQKVVEQIHSASDRFSSRSE